MIARRAAGTTAAAAPSGESTPQRGRFETRSRAKDDIRRVMQAFQRVRRWEKKWVESEQPGATFKVYKWVPLPEEENENPTNEEQRQDTLGVVSGSISYTSTRTMKPILHLSPLLPQDGGHDNEESTATQLESLGDAHAPASATAPSALAMSSAASSDATPPVASSGVAAVSLLDTAAASPSNSASFETEMESVSTSNLDSHLPQAELAASVPPNIFQQTSGMSVSSSSDDSNNSCQAAATLSSAQGSTEQSMDTSSASWTQPGQTESILAGAGAPTAEPYTLGTLDSAFSLSQDEFSSPDDDNSHLGLSDEPMAESSPVQISSELAVEPVPLATIPPMETQQAAPVESHSPVMAAPAAASLSSPISVPVGEMPALAGKQISDEVTTSAADIPPLGSLDDQDVDIVPAEDMASTAALPPALPTDGELREHLDAGTTTDSSVPVTDPTPQASQDQQSYSPLPPTLQRSPPAESGTDVMGDVMGDVMDDVIGDAIGDVIGDVMDADNAAGSPPALQSPSPPLALQVMSEESSAEPVSTVPVEAPEEHQSSDTLPAQKPELKPVTETASNTDLLAAEETESTDAAPVGISETVHAVVDTDTSELRGSPAAHEANAEPEVPMLAVGEPLSQHSTEQSPALAVDEVKEESCLPEAEAGTESAAACSPGEGKSEDMSAQLESAMATDGATSEDVEEELSPKGGVHDMEVMAEAGPATEEDDVVREETDGSVHSTGVPMDTSDNKDPSGQMELSEQAEASVDPAESEQSEAVPQFDDNALVEEQSVSELDTAETGCGAGQGASPVVPIDTQAASGTGSVPSPSTLQSPPELLSDVCSPDVVGTEMPAAEGMTDHCELNKGGLDCELNKGGLDMERAPDRVTKAEAATDVPMTIDNVGADATQSAASAVSREDRVAATPATLDVADTQEQAAEAACETDDVKPPAATTTATATASADTGKSTSPMEIVDVSPPPVRQSQPSLVPYGDMSSPDSPSQDTDVEDPEPTVPDAAVPSPGADAASHAAGDSGRAVEAEEAESTAAATTVSSSRDHNPDDQRSSRSRQKSRDRSRSPPTRGGRRSRSRSRSPLAPTRRPTH